MCTHGLKFMCIHCLHLCLHSVHVDVHPVDPVPIVTAISRVCLCCVESPVRSWEEKRASAAKCISSLAQVKPASSADGLASRVYFRHLLCRSSCSYNIIIMSSNINITKRICKSLEMFT